MDTFSVNLNNTIYLLYIATNVEGNLIVNIVEDGDVNAVINMEICGGGRFNYNTLYNYNLDAQIIENLLQDLLSVLEKFNG